MPRHSDARQRMIQSAAVLFRERGIEGTSFSDVLAHSGAPRGSIYHHFPDGKTQLATEATEWAGEYILASTAAALADDDPIGALAASRRWWTKILKNSDYQAGCVIVAATIEGGREPSIRAAAEQAFTQWENVLTDALRRRGIAAARARSLATLLIAAIEGAVILSRAKQTTTPLIRVSTELQRILTDALDRSPV
jgi:AcrR family transcriptional regulator